MKGSTTVVDFTEVTEAPGTAVTVEALEMLWTRYAFAAEYCAGRDVLELACGPGQGLAHLASVARRLVGGDYTHALLRYARAEYGDSIPVLRLDAQGIPFRDASFDTVIMFEAMYYLARPGDFLRECRRVLRPGGRLVLCSVNPEWSDFNPSPLSHRYWSANELRVLLAEHGFTADLFAAFDTVARSHRDRVASAVKRVAVALGVVPKTMKGKRLLKRLFLGRVTPAPGRVQAGMAAFRTPLRIEDGRARCFKVLYAVAGRS